MTKTHSFHIPVMGIAFTLDTPLKVAPYGIDSVISLIDDMLMEKMRKFYCEKFNLLYQEISDNVEDFRAKRITSYLNLIQDLAKARFESLKSAGIEKGNELKKYLDMLPSGSELREKIKDLQNSISLGSIDVNIMTKVDKVNYRDKDMLPNEFNDAHAALRGYANSELRSSLILSAGMNPRLYGYLEQFDAFYPNAEGIIAKKIVLKVSDYRSAFIQGKFLANKGIWVSEYRIESGLNCGGHAFATDGYLMGPILAEFRDRRNELSEALHEIWIKALLAKDRPVPKASLPIKVTAQGGVGTADEHQFLLDHYQLDSVGWGTPFLLVPEATTVDESTINKLVAATEKDLYMSNISPLGVPFNTLKGNTKDEEKETNIRKGRPGSSCPKKYIAVNYEFAETGLCTASRQYQHLKIKELKEKELPAPAHAAEYARIIEKSCICVGLGTSALLVNDLNTKTEGPGVSICPGPNMAYFSKTMSLKEITDHIYGRADLIARTDRPHMFIKELTLYMDYLKNKFNELVIPASNKDLKYLSTFSGNLHDGMRYYFDLFDSLQGKFESKKAEILWSLEKMRQDLALLNEKIASLMYQPELTH